jgi:hypothetical protein
MRLEFPDQNSICEGDLDSVSSGGVAGNDLRKDLLDLLRLICRRRTVSNARCKQEAQKHCASGTEFCHLADHDDFAAPAGHEFPLADLAELL